MLYQEFEGRLLGDYRKSMSKFIRLPGNSSRFFPENHDHTLIFFGGNTNIRSHGFYIQGA